MLFPTKLHIYQALELSVLLYAADSRMITAADIKEVGGVIVESYASTSTRVTALRMPL